MKTGKNIITPSLLTSVLLILGAFPIVDYNYYVLLRWVVCLIAIYIAYHSYKSKKNYWFWVMGIVALVFNPVSTFHFEKETWAVIDIVAAVLFGVTILIFIPKNKDK